MNKTAFTIRIVIVISFLLMLLPIQIFVYPSMWQTFSIMCMSITTFILSCLYRKGLLKETFSIPHLLFFAWGSYIAIYSLCFDCEMYTVTYYLSSYLLFFGTVRMIQLGLLSPRFIYNMIIFGAIIEVGICLLQQVGLIPPVVATYPVTGTFANPNITAMFVALALPCTIDLTQNTKYRAACIIIILWLIFGLIVLRCRTAYLGALFSIIYWGYHYMSIRCLKAPYRRIIIGIVLCLLPIGGYALYHMKKESADGRLFVWKVSTSLLCERPLQGYGYGRFSAVYNPYQEEYVETHISTIDEIQNMRRVNMPYNEFIEQSLGGGMWGGLLFMAIPLYMCVSAVRHRQRMFIAISANILIMMSVNFVTQAGPVWTLYVLLLAIQASKEDISIPYGLRHFIFIGTMTCLLFCGIGFTHKVISQYQLSKALSSYSENPEAALTRLERYLPYADTSECYLRYYGKMLLQAGRYDEALPILEKASRYSSLPDLQNDIVIAKFKSATY